MVTKERQYEKDRDQFFRWFVGIGISGILFINGFHMRLTLEQGKAINAGSTKTAVIETRIDNIVDKDRDQDKQLVQLWNKQCMKPEEIKFPHDGAD